jgi:hypothetical protein
MLKNCCDSGRVLHLQNVHPFLKLRPLTPEIKKLFLDNTSHISKSSSFYNNILAFCTTGVDNGKGGGFENRIGPHCVTIHGRIYHNFPKVNSTNPSGGLGYMMFDHVSEMYYQRHVEQMKNQLRDEVAQENQEPTNEEPSNPFDDNAFNYTNNNNDQHVDDGRFDINISIMNVIKTFLLERNVYAIELESIGRIITGLEDETSVHVRAMMGERVQHFDVSLIRSNNLEGERVIHVKPKGISDPSE